MLLPQSLTHELRNQSRSEAVFVAIREFFAADESEDEGSEHSTDKLEDSVQKRKAEALVPGGEVNSQSDSRVEGATGDVA
jgi:hypothetical protein